MAWFPFFMELSGREGLIVGGGTVALRKIEKLLPFGPELRVVAQEIHPRIRKIPGLRLEQRPFADEDIHEHLAFVIAATDDAEQNHSIAALCRERRIPVNVVDDPQACTFLFPALVQKGRLTVGISTAGASPTAAIRLKEQIMELLPEEYGGILDFLEEKRPEVKRTVPEKNHAWVMKRLCDECLKQGGPLTEEACHRILEGAMAPKEAQQEE